MVEPISMTIPQVAEHTGWSRSEIYRLLHAGQLRAVKQNRKTLVVWASVVDHAATLPAAVFAPSPSKGK
jgi:excisionase family DNA binding protein